ncbi:MAG: hypothetical protein H7Y04_08345 [Verrucomicrobia bacterium]|nr:hypothetical protein [Cytophagales bacterium]
MLLIREDIKIAMPIIKNEDLKISFLLSVSEKWAEHKGIISANGWYFLPLVYAKNEVVTLLDEYLLTGVIMGGFAIEIAGESWNNYYFGQLPQTMQWFNALHRLHKGEKVIITEVFDESKLLLRRVSEHELTLYETWDDYYPRTDFCWEINVDFQHFTEKIFAEGKILVNWIETFNQAIEQRKKSPSWKDYTFQLEKLALQASKSFIPKLIIAK